MAQDSSPRVAYLVGRYPAIPHTFILREIEALRDLGVQVETFSIWRTGPDQHLGAAERAEAANTHSFLPLRRRRAIRCHLAAMAASPAGYMRLWRRALRISRPGARGVYLALSWAVEAPMLWYELRARGIRHVHAHLPGTAPSVAMLATGLANAAEASGRHTWSLTVHGPSEFYDVHNQAVGPKVEAADFAVAISDFGRSQLMGLVGDDHWDKLHVVHCGVRPERYEQRSHAAASDGPVRLLTVGRLAPVKGQALLLAAVRELRSEGVDVVLTVIGDGPKRDALEDAGRKLGLDQAVEFAGAIGQDEIARYYLGADIYVHPSFAEGVPVVIMEAMAHALPVVAAGVMGVRELVHDGENGLVVRPGRKDELVDAVRRLAGDPSERARMGQSGRRTVEAEFDVKGSAQLLRDLFTSPAS